MANHVSAQKRVRTTERRTEYNRFATTRLRHQIRAMRKALAEKVTGETPGKIAGAMKSTFSLLDKAAQKGYIKRGTAARYKSRLHKRIKTALGQNK